MSWARRGEGKRRLVTALWPCMTTCCTSVLRAGYLTRESFEKFASRRQAPGRGRRKHVLTFWRGVLAIPGASSWSTRRTGCLSKGLNLLRDVHDRCRVPIVLIGEEPLKGKLSQERRLISRTSQELIFQPAGPADVTLFYRKNLNLALSPKMAVDLARHAQGDFRRSLRTCSASSGR